MRIGFIGGGQMCEGIVKGVFKTDADISITISDPSAQRRKCLEGVFPKAKITESNETVVLESDVVVLAIKPQQLAVATSVLPKSTHALYVSICAGVTLTRLAECLPTRARIARVMPNLPAMVGEGATGFCLNSFCAPEDGEYVSRIFTAVGSVVEQVPEHLMDVITGVSGSGPAYVCLLIEAMADAAVAQGMPREAAIRLAAQTCVGAGKLILTGGDSFHPAVIKDKVCSPGGTSIAAVAALEEKGFRGAIIAGVRACIDRARQLGNL